MAETTNHQNPFLELSVRWPLLYAEFQKEFEKPIHDKAGFENLAKDVVRAGIVKDVDIDQIDDLYGFYQEKYKELTSMPLMQRMVAEKAIKARLHDDINVKALKAFLRDLRDVNEALFERLKKALRRSTKKKSTPQDVRQFVHLLAEANDYFPQAAVEV